MKTRKRYINVTSQRSLGILAQETSEADGREENKVGALNSEGVD